MDDKMLGIGGSLTTILAATGITTEVVQIIYYILGAVGFALTIASAIMSWYKKAKADGKITIDEVQEIVDDVNKKVQDAEKEIKK